MSEGEPAHASTFSNKSRETLVGKHDGHTDGHLNCIGMRHGWSRTFSLEPEEVASLSYETLCRALECHTLNLRPMMLRIFVEHPATSGTWCKIRPFKNDGSLQSVLVRAFFDQRLQDGTVTVMEIRDGADRREEGDGLSLRRVGSRVAGSGIFHPMEKSEDKRTSGWLSRFITTVKVVTAPKPGVSNDSTTQLQDIGEDGDDSQPANTQKKGCRALSDHIHHLSRRTPAAVAYFPISSSAAPPPRSPTPPPNVSAEQEAETLRKRGWMPPGLAKRQVSLRKRLSARKQRKEKTQNPFLGGKAGENPFTDPETAEVPDEDGEAQDVDDFFEMERPDVAEMGNGNSKDKPWSRFTPKRTKGKGKGKAVDNAPTPPQEPNPSEDVE
ncbi:hypothetical protein BDZ89DRAFT_1033798 [Hymenopellis radicata]|nr:hypothetical protein BDZ89DRAFT_1033798 [Hymenopellis radicata]